MAKIPRNCEWCGNGFLALSWEVNRGRGRYCSVNCKGAFGRSLQSQVGVNNPAWKGGVWRENTARQAAEWNKANPEKRRAHHAVEQAIITGKLIKMPCEVCGDRNHVDAHHDDYTKPLSVRWLCRRCHLREHRLIA